MMQPLVSVVIPAYNCAGFIDETLRTVYRQTYRNLEIVVVDDGSTDRTKETLQRHTERIRYVHQENKGTAAARNKGVTEARGELVAFLDNDDLWLPDKIEKQVEAFVKFTDCALVFTNGKTFDESGIDRESLIPKHLQEWIDHQDHNDADVITGQLLKEFLTANVISSATGAMVKKRVIEALGGFDETIAIADDYDLWLRIAKKYPVGFIPTCLYMWRYRADSQSGHSDLRQHNWNKACINVLEKHLSSLATEMKPGVRQRLATLYWDCGCRHFNSGQYQESRCMFRGSLYHRPFFVSSIFYLIASFLNRSLVERLRHLRRQLAKG